MVGLVAFLGSLVLAVIVGVAQSKLGVPLMWPMILATASWAAWDSTKVRIREYQTGVALHPVALWFGISFLWIVGFPWYLAARYKAKNGTLARKPVPAAVPAA